MNISQKKYIQCCYRLIEWLESIVEQSVIAELSPVKVAMLKNMVSGLNRYDSAVRAIGWAQRKLEIPKEIRDQAEAKYRIIIRESQEELTREYLSSLHPSNPEYDSLWIEACMKCVDAELEGDRHRMALGWIKAQALETVGARETAILFAKRSKPGPDESHQAWAEGAFIDFMKLDLADQGPALDWLEKQIPVVDDVLASERIENMWRRYHNARRQPQRKPVVVEHRRDTLRSSALVSASDINELKPVAETESNAVEPAEEEISAMIKTIRTEMLAIGIEYADDEVYDALAEDARRRVLEQQRGKKAA